MLCDQDRFYFCVSSFEQCIDEALAVTRRCDNADNLSPAILRGSLLLGVSAFDFLIHEIVRIELTTMVRNGSTLVGFEVPVSILIAPVERRVSDLELFIRKRDSYKAFVSPQNVKDVLRPAVSNIWQALAAETTFDESETKMRLKNIWKWRNRIAHEGDYRPSTTRCEKWPIYQSDVLEELEFLKSLGRGIANTLTSLR